MPIKKSYLEKKWYYRVAKAFFLLLPLLVAAFVFLKGYINISNITYIAYAVGGLILYYLVLKLIWRLFLYIAFGGLEDDVRPVASVEQPTPAKPNPAAIIPIIIIIAIIAIFVLSERGYIKLPKINFDSEQSSHTYGAPCKTSDGKTGIYGTNGNCYTCSSGTAVTNPVNNCSDGIAGVYCCNSGNNNNGCISTGCNSMWYCSGSYYIGNQEITVPGLCFPVHPDKVYSSWTGVCRQCP